MLTVVVLHIYQIVTLTIENVSIVNIMATARFTETKSVEVVEGALTMDIEVCPVSGMCKAKKKFQVLNANALP